MKLSRDVFIAGVGETQFKKHKLDFDVLGRMAAFGSIVIRREILVTGFYVLIIQVLLFSVATIAVAENTDTAEFRRFWPDNLFAVDFVNDKTGFIAGYSGTVLRTIDGGESWDFFYIGRSELIRRLSFSDELNGWAAGHRGSIFHTDNGGESWQVQKELPGLYLRDIYFVDKLNGWVVGHDANIWHTSDGGKNWEQQYLLGFKGRDAPRLNGIYAKDAKTAILVGEFGVIGHTENGGTTWLTTPVESATTWLMVTGVRDSFFAVGLDGAIAQLSIATPEQREQIDNRQAAKEAMEEVRLRKKAKRLKRLYVKKEVTTLPVAEIEYKVDMLKSGTKEHLFAVAPVDDNSVIAVGRSMVLKISGTTVTKLEAAKGFPLPYIWLGGVTVTPSGVIWAAGIRGMIVTGTVNSMSFSSAFNLATSEKITQKSSRWGNNK